MLTELSSLRPQSRSVSSHMVPLQRVFTLAETATVDDALLSRIADTAHSRIPVLAGDGSDRNAIVGERFAPNLYVKS